LTKIRAIKKAKQAVVARKSGSEGILEMSPEEKDRRCKIWKIAEAEYSERKSQLKRDGMPVKYAGEKPLLRWFNEANDPDALLQDLRRPNQAFSAPTPIQTRRQRCERLFSEEDDGEWTDEDGLRND
jgi:hypothetical protein